MAEPGGNALSGGDGTFFQMELALEGSEGSGGTPGTLR
jgi:hypothetical protein